MNDLSTDQEVPLIVSAKWIRSAERHLAALTNGQWLRFGVPIGDLEPGQLEGIGFEEPFPDGQQVLPSWRLGPDDRFIAEGGEQVHRDLPKETVYHLVWRTWVEFHGPNRVPSGGFRDVPYSRYPRTPIPAPGTELTLATTPRGERVVVSPALVFDAKQPAAVLHVANLFLELFGEAWVFSGDLAHIRVPTLVRVNWQILPPGTRLTPELVDRILRQVPEHGRERALASFGALEARSPSFLVVGQGGFEGYVVFAFPEQNLFVLERPRWGNATYVFRSDWEELSKYSKTQILEEGRQFARVIHNDSWQAGISEVFRRGRQAA